MPAAAARSRISSSTIAEQSRMGSSGRRSSSIAAASKPSTAGIRASSTTTSGSSAASAATASPALAASPAYATSGPASWRIARTRKRTSAWSSTTSTRTGRWAGSWVMFVPQYDGSGVVPHRNPPLAREASAPVPPIDSSAMPSHDVLIIGAGLAGQRAALAAARSGATVAIMSKVHPVRSHSNAAAGGINAALNPDDSWESHAFDTVKGSDYLGDQDAIEIMCREAPDEVLWLEHQGVTFHRNEQGLLGTRAFGGASAARTYYVADITGQALLHVLYEQLMKSHAKIDSYEEWFVTALVQDDDGNCCGAIARNIRDGAMEIFTAKATIQASGGAGQCFKPTTNALICTGDGIAQSFRVGAPLMDMEMIQYHPTTLAGNGILITEGARGEGAHLYNAHGERFMEKYAPNKMELAS